MAYDVSHFSVALDHREQLGCDFFGYNGICLALQLLRGKRHASTVARFTFAASPGTVWVSKRERQTIDVLSRLVIILRCSSPAPALPLSLLRIKITITLTTVTDSVYASRTHDPLNVFICCCTSE